VKGIDCFLAASSILAVGCAEEGPKLFTAPISLQLDLKESDIQDGVLSRDKNISTEQGNPWSKFVQDAKASLGRDPTAFEITTAQVTLDAADSENVDAFDDLTTTGELRLVATKTDGEVPIGFARQSKPSGTLIKPAITASKDDLAPLYQPMLGSDFKVRIEVDTTRTDKDKFKADLSVTLTAGAY
jgi:hypothetical protein